MRFFTLIHVAKDEQSIHNNSFVKSFEDQINLYFLCAKQLHLSLKPAEIELIIITNDKSLLQKLNKDEYEIEIIQKDFTLKVPSGVKFYSAHFKIEIYNYLASLQDDYIGLVDCDMVCINEVPQCFKNVIDAKVPLYYDITDQVTPAYSAKRIIADKEKLGNAKSIGLWAGGEFIAGSPSFFSRLYNEIELIKPAYFSDFNSYNHQGDEMLTSVAIENMLLDSDVRILDAGTLSIIGRFWSHKPLHIQKSISAYSKHFLLHLPSDKKFITNLKQDELKGKAFFKNYEQHLFISRLIENTFKGIKPYVRSLRKKLSM